MTIQEGDLLWTPSPALVQTSQLARFMHWLREHRSTRTAG